MLVAGAVTHRQRPATAQGVTFINLEDETGMVNVLCSPGVWARHRKLAQTASALLIRGQVQNATGAVTVVADRLQPDRPADVVEVAGLPLTCTDYSRGTLTYVSAYEGAPESAGDATEAALTGHLTRCSMSITLSWPHGSACRRPRLRDQRDLGSPRTRARVDHAPVAAWLGVSAATTS